MNAKKRPVTFWLPVLFMLAAMLACNISQAVAPVTVVNVPSDESVPSDEPVVVNPTETVTPVPIVHLMVPGDPPVGLLSWITDLDSSDYAPEHRTNGGDDFSKNLYERPFNTQVMDQYFPDLDIINTRMMRDSNWYYLNIELVGQDASGQMSGVYGLELDLNIDGRGDFLVMASKPAATWSTDGVRVWSDKNGDVGSTYPIHSDAPVNGDGYETIVFDQGVGSDPDAAWARLSPSDPNSVQIAFKRSLISDDGTFMWGAWTMSESTLDPAWFDYNDHFTIDEAGSPLQALTKYYPIKALAEVDNTCRWAVGFTPVGTEPGICPLPVPTPTATPILPGAISGRVFADWNTNGVPDPAEGGFPGVTVRVRSGSCGSPGSTVATATTNASGNYSVSVSARSYCVDVPTPPYDHGGTPVDVTVNPGSTATANFGFYYIIF